LHRRGRKQIGVVFKRRAQSVGLFFDFQSQIKLRFGAIELERTQRQPRHGDDSRRVLKRKHCLEERRPVRASIGAQFFIKPEVFVNFAAKKFDEKTLELTDQPTKDMVKLQLETYEKFLRRWTGKS